MKVEKIELRKGFTLIELLTVMTIMIIITSISTVSYFGLGQGARLRGSVNALRGKISLARQYAILKTTETEVRFGDPVSGQHYYYVYDTRNHYTVGETNYLPLGVKLGQLPTGSVIPFKSTGTSGTAGPYEVEVVENDDRENSLWVEVYGVTGLVQVR